MQKLEVKIQKKHLVNKQIIKTTKKLTYIILLILLSLTVFINLLNIFFNYLEAYTSPEHTFAKNILISEANLSALMLIIFAFSLFLNKKVMMIIWILAFWQIPNIFSDFPETKKLREINACDDMEYCVEGVRIWVTKEDCETKEKAWNIDDNACQYRFDLKNCYKLKGNWQYPTTCKN